MLFEWERFSDERECGRQYSVPSDMGQLTKSVYKGEDDGVALGCRPTSYKVQRDMRPGTMGDGQGVQEAGMWAVRGLILVTGQALTKPRTFQ